MPLLMKHGGGLAMRRLDPAGHSPENMLIKLAKFSVVGLSGVGVNSGILYLLYEMLHLPLVGASVMAVETAIVSNFLWNTLWTFHDPTPSIRRFAKFNLVSLGGMIITTATLQSLVGFLGMHYQIANLIGIGLATVWNFGLNLVWTWGWD